MLPASAEGAVELDETLVFGAASLSQSELGGKKRTLAVEDFEERGGTARVAHVGEADGFLQVGDGLFLAHANLVEFLVADEGVGNVAEGVLNGLLVGEQSLLMLRFGQFEISAESAAGENRLADLRAVGPDSEL